MIDLPAPTVVTKDTRLLVAAGGGGDAIAAAMIHAALEPTDERARIATYSWDRLLIDPLPGPRHPSWFRGLEEVGRRNFRVRPSSNTKPPAGSILPRLAGELAAELYLLDPRGGAVGLRQQLEELAQLLDVETVQVVDVGGDILARGGEPDLRSPLADALVLAGTSDIRVPVEVLVTGAGLDAELDEELVLSRCRELGAELDQLESHQRALRSFGELFGWHPSEATGMLWAAAMGARGVAEIRDSGRRVALTDQSCLVFRLGHQRALDVNHIAQRVATTTSLESAEDLLREAGWPCETDYERRKVARPSPVNGSDNVTPEGIADRLVSLREEALARAVDFLPIRRLAEQLGVSGKDLPFLQAQLDRHRPGEYRPPLWVLRPEAWNGEEQP